jgi:small-conductance mechanosensitive channel
MVNKGSNIEMFFHYSITFDKQTNLIASIMKSIWLILTISIFFSWNHAYPQENNSTGANPQADISTPAYPVVVHGDTLYNIRASLGPFTPQERAKAGSARLVQLLKEPDFDPDSLIMNPVDEDYYITYKDMVVMVVTQADTLGTGLTTEEAAKWAMSTLKTKIVYLNERYSAKRILSSIAHTALILFVLIIIILILNRLFRWLLTWIAKNRERLFRSLKIQSYEYLPVERQHKISIYLLRLLKVALIITIFLIALPLIFSIFPATEGITRKIVGMIWSPVKNILLSVVNYLPKLITIIIIYILFRYLVRLFRFLAKEVDARVLVIPGFHPDWAKTTFNIIRVLLYAFMFVMMFPYLPGSDSAVFRGVSVFFGVLLSLGSTSLISNSVAGLVITYMRPFKTGDRIKLDDILGVVMEKSMMITRIRTLKNEDITIPNSKILTSYIVNYSTPAEDKEGLIIHTTVTIGYDAPWRTVHKLLISAAGATEGVLKNPSPFVLQTSLDDFFVSYQINAYIKNVKQLLKIKSELHENIQDHFNKAGVEIMSPHYRSERDGNEVAIPKDWEIDLPDLSVKPSPGKKSDKKPKSGGKE